MKKPTVLVLEDDQELRDFICYLLTNDNFEVIQASQASDAIPLIEKGGLDIILLDLMLPDIDGISCCEIIRKTPATQNTPIIIITGWVTASARNLGLKHGANAYLAKPFNPRQLISITRELLLRNQPEEEAFC